MNRAESETESESHARPASCAVAFKEWAGVCQALAEGRQSIILRKGGIEEGPGGFVPEHDAFWFYPTRVHQAEQGLKPGASARLPPAAAEQTGSIALGTLAVVEFIGRIEQSERLGLIDDLHVWTAETVEARFQYRRPGLWVLGVRVFRREPPWTVPITPAYAGCKTWVPLESPLTTAGLVPALDEASFEARMQRLRAVLGSAATG